MKEIIHEGIEGIFFTDAEFEKIKSKIKANDELISSLMKEVGLIEQTI